MKTILILILICLTGLNLGAVIGQIYIWHQIESQALPADLAEGAQP
jgi:divalent metal cation (Fe/Co/Zn/Cd) transporter